MEPITPRTPMHRFCVASTASGKGGRLGQRPWGARTSCDPKNSIGPCFDDEPPWSANSTRAPHIALQESIGRQVMRGDVAHVTLLSTLRGGTSRPDGGA